jgi:hypothetical protein
MKTSAIPSPSLVSGVAALLLAAASPAKAAGLPKVYRFTATAANTTDAIMTLDHAAFNAKSKLRLIVTQYSTGVSNPHPIGVRYNYATKKWQIFNEDSEDIPVNANFNVMVAPTAKPVTVSSANLDGGLAFFPLQKGNFSAKLMVTHMSNPVAALNGTVQPYNIGLFRIPAGTRAPIAADRWSIYMQNGEPHLAATYNVADVTNMKSGNTPLAFWHSSTDANTTDAETVITNTLTDGKPDAVLFIQHVFTTTGQGNVDETLGVRYADGKWRIFVQDGDDMPVTKDFAVVAFPAATP